MTHWSEEQLTEYMTRTRRGPTPGVSFPPSSVRRTPAECEIPDEGPESRLQARIVAWAREWGRPCLSFRQSRQARGFLTPGWPDVTIAMPGGRTLYLELKTAKGIVKEEQRQIHLQLMALGHEVHVIRSYRAFLEVLRKPSTQRR